MMERIDVVVASFLLDGVVVERRYEKVNISDVIDRAGSLWVVFYDGTRVYHINKIRYDGSKYLGFRIERGV